MATPELPEPMNSSPHHSKVKIMTTLSDPTFLAGSFVSGKLDMECRADQGLGIGILMVELFAIQELSSRDRSATSTFLHSRRLFQGPGLPPSNAVQQHTMPGDPLLPQHYYQAKRGKSTFLFRIPIPASSPPSISFASGLAKVRYELRASVGVYWKNEKKLVVDNKTVYVVQAYPYQESLGGLPEAIVVGENGKLCMQGRMVGGPVVAGECACLELQVKNHSNKKNSNLTLTLTRTLYLPGQQQPASMQISDTLTTVPFRGPEYIIPPGAEGVANLVFDVPKHARGVQGGILDGEGEEDGGQPRRTESLFEIRCIVQVKLGMGIGSNDVILEIPIDVVHPMAVPQQPIPSPFAQQPAPYTYANHPPIPDHMPYADYASYYPNQPAYIDPARVQPWSQSMEPPLYLPQGYPHGYANSGPPLLPPFQPFYPMPDFTGGHTPPALHAFDPGLSPPLPYLPPTDSYQPVFMHAIPPPVPTMPPQMDNYFASQIPIPSSPVLDAVVHSPRPQLTPRHSFTRDPVLGALTISKSERVEELEKMADEVAKRNRDLSGDLPTVSAAAVGEPDEKVNHGDDYLNLNKTLPGPPVPSDKFGDMRKDGVMSKQEEPQQRGERSRDLMSVFPSDYHHPQELVQPRDYFHRHSQEQQQLPGGRAYQTPPTPTLMAVLGPPKPTLTSESGLDALERRLLAEVGTTRKHHLEYWDNNNNAAAATTTTTHHDNDPVITEETKVSRDRQQLGRRDDGDVLLPPGLVGITITDENHHQRLPPLDTDLDLDLDMLVRGEAGGGGEGGASAPIEIPMKSPDPLNESCISSLTLGGEGLVSGGLLPDTGLGLNNNGGGGAAAADSDEGEGEGEGEAEFDGKTHRAGSASSMSRASENGSGRMVSGAHGRRRGGFHKHMRQRAEVGTPTEMVPKGRVKSRRVGGGGGSGGGGSERKEKVKSSSKKKERLNGTGSGSEPKKSRNKSSAATKGRVAAWLGGIDPGVPPQEEIIPPSPSVVRDLDGLSFEDEQNAALAAGSPLGPVPAAAAPLFSLYPDSDSPTTPGGALAFKIRTHIAATTTAHKGGDDADEINMDQDQDDVVGVSASPNPRSSGFVSITTLKRDTISMPLQGSSSAGSPLLLRRDATVIEEARRVQELWSSTPPGIAPLDKDAVRRGGGVGGAAMSFLPPPERIKRKLTPSSSFIKPAAANVVVPPPPPLSYSAAVTSSSAAAATAASSSVAPAAGTSSSGAAAATADLNLNNPHSNVFWKNNNADQHQKNQSRQTVMPPPSTTAKPPGYYYKPPPGGGKLPVFSHPSNPHPIPHPIDHNDEVKYDIRSARGGRGGKVTSVASLWASGAINNQRHTHQTTTLAANSDVKDKAPESSSDKPVKMEKKLFSAAVMTPAPASKNVRKYTPVASGSGSGGGPKKMVSTPALPVRSVDVLGGKAAAAANRSTDNVTGAVQKRPAPMGTASTTTTTTINVFQGGKTTPTGNFGGGTKGTAKPAAVNGPPGVVIKATSDPAVISSSHAVPTLSSTASLVIPHDQTTTTANQQRQRHPRAAVVKLPPSTTTPGFGSRPGSPRSFRVEKDNNTTTTTNSNPTSKSADLAFGQARLRDLIKKYQGSSLSGGGTKM